MQSVWLRSVAPMYEHMPIRHNFNHLHSKLLSTNDIKFDWSAALWLVLTNADGQNFVVPSYTLTSMLQKELKSEGYNLKLESWKIGKQDDFWDWGKVSSTEFRVNVRFISYSKCSNWCQISKLLSNFGCLFTFWYSAWANWIKTKLQTFLTYKLNSQ